MLSRGRVLHWTLAAWRRVAGAPRAGRFVAAVAVLLAALAVTTCLVVFVGNPRTVDGFADLFQARIFLSGRLWAPAPPADIAANFSTLHMIVGPARWFSQYPPGQALDLAAGLAFGAWWLLNPVFAAILVAATYRAARWCSDETTARLAAVLLCLSPFVVAVSGSELSHLPAAALAMAAAARRHHGRRRALARGRRARGRRARADGDVPPPRRRGRGGSRGPRPPAGGAAAAAGGGGGDRRRGGRGAQPCPSCGTTAGRPARGSSSATPTSGAPSCALGFHPVPWGMPSRRPGRWRSPGEDLHQLNMYLFDSPFPVLVLVALGFVAGRRRLGLRDGVPMAGVLALMTIFFFYWHRDVFYGPRFLFSAVPWFVVLGARALTALRRAGREVLPGVTAGFVAVFGFAAILAVGLATVTPQRFVEYHRGTPVFDLHPDRDARRVGIHDAVVVIPDGWGTRLITRMWALGVAPRLSTRLYGAIDACTLEQALDGAALDATGRTRRRLVGTLDSLARPRSPRRRDRSDRRLESPPAGRRPAAAGLRRGDRARREGVPGLRAVPVPEPADAGRRHRLGARPGAVERAAARPVPRPPRVPLRADRPAAAPRCSRLAAPLPAAARQGT